MSHMSELDIEIRELLEDDINPVTIARRLGIPLTWVYDTLESMEPDEDEPFNPNNTVNS